jgi:hypothetical protein
VEISSRAVRDAVAIKAHVVALPRQHSPDYGQAKPRQRELSENMIAGRVGFY